MTGVTGHVPRGTPITPPLSAQQYKALRVAAAVSRQPPKAYCPPLGAIHSPVRERGASATCRCDWRRMSDASVRFGPPVRGPVTSGRSHVAGRWRAVPPLNTVFGPHGSLCVCAPPLCRLALPGGLPPIRCFCASRDCRIHLLHVLYSYQWRLLGNEEMVKYLRRLEGHSLDQQTNRHAVSQRSFCCHPTRQGPTTLAPVLRPYWCWWGPCPGAFLRSFKCQGEACAATTSTSLQAEQVSTPTAVSRSNSCSVGRHAAR